MMCTARTIFPWAGVLGSLLISYLALTPSGVRGQVNIDAGVEAAGDEAIPRPFLRGDANSDGCVNIDDAAYIFNALFQEDRPQFPCMDAADANDDDRVTTADAVYLRTFLNAGGPPPPPPFPACGLELNRAVPSRALGCQRYPPRVCEAGCTQAAADLATFQRGDANGDGRFNLADALTILTFLFRTGADRGRLPCLDAGDVNDNGILEVSDPLYLLLFLFSRRGPPPPPFPRCGEDPTPDRLIECRPLGCGLPRAPEVEAADG